MFRQGGGAIEIALVTLLVQYSASPAAGFQIAFITTAVIVLTAIPAIMLMPARAVQAPKEAVAEAGRGEGEL